MRNKVAFLSLAFFLLSFSIATAQEAARRQLIVPLAEGGFVGFKSETSWMDAKRAGPELQPVPAIVGSEALTDDKQLIHRVLTDTAGRFVFGYDLWIAANPAAKQFKIVVRPLDEQFDRKLRAGDPGADRLPQSEPISTFPKAAEPQTLDDGDAFSLDVLFNQRAGVKIVDVVKVTFDRASLWDVNPRMLPRDFSLDAVELAVKDYRLLVNGNVVSVGKSTKGCAGALLWFYIPDRGRFIFSLVPREGYAFQKVGIISDNKIEFTINGDRYEWLSSAPVVRPGGAWNLWVLPDPRYSPLFGSEPAPQKKKGVLDKWDDLVVATQNSTVKVRSQKTLTGVTAPQTQTATDRPRVMIGGADTIENLWPRNP